MSDWDSAHRGPRTVEICPCCERRNGYQEPDGDDTCDCAPCEHCKELVRDGEDCGNEECPGNCEHSDRDAYCCLICGADLTEATAVAAYDQAKGRRYE